MQVVVLAQALQLGAQFLQQGLGACGGGAIGPNGFTPLAQGRGHRGDGTGMAIGGFQAHDGIAQGRPGTGPLQGRQHGAGGHRRQLGRIAHQHQAAAGGQGLHQGRHQLQIHHRHLIDDQQIEAQGMVSVAHKTVAPLLQQAVQGRTGMAVAGGLAQAAGRLARRGGQVDAGLGAMLLQRPDHGGNGAGFARSRAPLQQHQAPGQHRPNRPSLLLIEGSSSDRRGLGRRC